MAHRPSGAALTCSCLLPALLYLTPWRCAVGLLDLEPGVLQHVALHLSGRALQNLMGTCRLLRASPSLRGAVTKASSTRSYFKRSHDVPLLLQCTGLQKLHLSSPGSLYHLHGLSVLGSLRKLSIVARLGCGDLAPLAALQQLRALTLESSHPIFFLEDLTQLTRLKLRAHGKCLVNLRGMTCLSRLNLKDALRIPSLLSHLTRLTRVDFGRAVMDSGLEADEAAEYLRQLPAMRVVFAETRLLHVHTGLTHLTALHLELGDRAEQLDVSGLSGLLRLGLVHTVPWAFSIIAPTATFLQLQPYHFERGHHTPLPSMASCPSLQYLKLLAHDSIVTVAPAQLPAQQVHISALVGEAGQVFKQCGVRHAFSLDFYDQLAEWTARVPRFQ